jgi:hypothetical protein
MIITPQQGEAIAAINAILKKLDRDSIKIVLAAVNGSR